MAITELLYRYAELIDAGDFDGVGAIAVPCGRYFDSFTCDPDVGPAGWYFTERKVEIQMIGDVSAHLMVDPTNFG